MEETIVNVDILSILDQLSDFSLEDPIYTAYFIKAHELLDLIQNSVQKLIEILPEGQSVQFLIEQDTWDDDPRLELSAIVELEVEAAIDYLHRFDHEFWFEARWDGQQWMSVDIQFL